VTDTDNSGFSTRAIHAGAVAGSSAVPIYQGNTNYRPGYQATNSYGRGLQKAGGPTSGAVEAQMKALEGAEWALATSCGMAAISQTQFGLLRSGDRVVCHRNAYSGSTFLLREDLPDRWQVSVEWVDMRDIEKLKDALRKKTRLVYFEVVSNSNMDVIDVSAAAAAAHEAGALVVVDNTFLTPYLMRPIEHGADVVIYSATKYLSGHGDALGGFVLGNCQEIRERIHRMRIILGGVLSPMNAFLIMRGIKTLAMRMERHQSNAQKVAEFLESHPKVTDVRYPGLKSYYAHGVAAAQMSGFGGMMGFTPAPALDTGKFTGSLRMCKPWYSLGDVETLILDCKGYVRVSVGLEDPRDIIADMKQALEKA